MQSMSYFRPLRNGVLVMPFKTLKTGVTTPTPFAFILIPAVCSHALTLTAENNKRVFATLATIIYQLVNISILAQIFSRKKIFSCFHSFCHLFGTWTHYKICMHYCTSL